MRSQENDMINTASGSDGRLLHAPMHESALMLQGPQIFVDIDTQRDFLELTGSLFVPGSTEIIPQLARLTCFARANKIPVLATACAHTPDDSELQTFPPHCMIGSPGQERIAATAWGDSMILDDSSEVPATIPSHLTLLKHAFDLFSHPRADALIGLYAAGRPLFVVYGVATDYCVLAAVEGLVHRHARVAIVADAIRAIDPEAESRILTSLAHRGVLLTVTDVVCGGNSTFLSDRSRVGDPKMDTDRRIVPVE
jgi:nicotinamidase/pyrazinamidase